MIMKKQCSTIAVDSCYSGDPVSLTSLNIDSIKTKDDKHIMRVKVPTNIMPDALMRTFIDVFAFLGIEYNSLTAMLIMAVLF